MSSSGELGASEPRSFRVVEAALKSLFVKGIDVLHLSGGQLKIKKVRVSFNAGSSHRFRNHDSGALKSPSE